MPDKMRTTNVDLHPKGISHFGIHTYDQHKIKDNEMWRVTALIVRQKDVPAEAFDERILDSLVPAMVAAIEEDRRLRRLIFNRRPANIEPEVAKAFPMKFDGFLEFWFDSAENGVAVMKALSRDARVRAAAAGLIDRKASITWMAEVFPKKAESGAAKLKFVGAGGNTAPGMSVDDAQKYWSEVHPLVAQSAPKVWELLTHYVQFHGREVSGLDLGDWLGSDRFLPFCMEVGLARQKDIVSLYSTDQYLAIVRPDEEKFSGPGEMFAFMSEEERDLIAPR